MAAYVVRRLLQAVPLLAGISFVAFVILRLAPGGPMAVYAQNPNMTEADMRRIEHLLGLDQPVSVQYVKWASGTLTGHLGFSYRTGRPVGAVILERVPATLELMVTAYLIAIVLGIATGVASAVKRYSVFDYVATPAAMVGSRSRFSGLVSLSSSTLPRRCTGFRQAASRRWARRSRSQTAPRTSPAPPACWGCG